MDKILVTGGTGLVGRYLHQILPDATYVSSKDYDLLDLVAVKNMYIDICPDQVIHLAAHVGGIMQNIKYPVDFYEKNILMNTHMLKCAYRYNVSRFVAILSSCAYPDVVDHYPISESELHNGPPAKTNLPYGYSKRSMAVHIDAYNNQYNTKYNYLIPCNLYGIYDNYTEGESHFIASLIRRIYNARKNGEDSITLFGTGKPLRQFMLASDLAKVIKLTIENDVTESFNVAPYFNYSIKEMAEKACGDLVLKFDNSYPDGQFRKDISISKFSKIFPDFEFTSFEKGIKETYDIMEGTWNDQIN